MGLLSFVFVIAAVFGVTERVEFTEMSGSHWGHESQWEEWFPVEDRIRQISVWNADQGGCKGSEAEGVNQISISEREGPPLGRYAHLMVPDQVGCDKGRVCVGGPLEYSQLWKREDKCTLTTHYCQHGWNSISIDYYYYGAKGLPLYSNGITNIRGRCAEEPRAGEMFSFWPGTRRTDTSTPEFRCGPGEVITEMRVLWRDVYTGVTDIGVRCHARAMRPTEWGPPLGLWKEKGSGTGLELHFESSKSIFEKRELRNDEERTFQQSRGHEFNIAVGPEMQDAGGGLEKLGQVSYKYSSVRTRGVKNAMSRAFTQAATTDASTVCKFKTPKKCEDSHCVAWIWKFIRVMVWPEEGQPAEIESCDLIWKSGASKMVPPACFPSYCEDDECETCIAPARGAVEDVTIKTYDPDPVLPEQGEKEQFAREEAARLAREADADRIAPPGPRLERGDADIAPRLAPAGQGDLKPLSPLQIDIPRLHLEQHASVLDAAASLGTEKHVGATRVWGKHAVNPLAAGLLALGGFVFLFVFYYIMENKRNDMRRSQYTSLLDEDV